MLPHIISVFFISVSLLRFRLTQNNSNAFFFYLAQRFALVFLLLLRLSEKDDALYAGVPISYKYSGAKPISFDQSTEKGSSLN